MRNANLFLGIVSSVVEVGRFKKVLKVEIIAKGGHRRTLWLTLTTIETFSTRLHQETAAKQVTAFIKYS